MGHKHLAVPSDAHGERQQGQPRQAPQPWPWRARPPAGSPDWVLSPFSPKEERVDSTHRPNTAGEWGSEARCVFPLTEGPGGGGRGRRGEPGPRAALGDQLVGVRGSFHLLRLNTCAPHSGAEVKAGGGAGRRAGVGRLGCAYKRACAQPAGKQGPGCRASRPHDLALPSLQNCE